MRIKYFIIGLSLLGLTTVSGEEIITTTPHTTIKEKSAQPKTDLSGYYQQLQNQLKLQQERVKALYTKATNQENAPMWVDKLELQNAIQVLDIKETLYANFINTPSMDNAGIRDYLLKLFTKPDISEGDLAILQSMVLENRANLKANQPAATTTTVPHNGGETTGAPQGK